MAPPAPDDPTRMPATGLAAALRDGAVSARGALEASLAVIAALDPDLHAFITVATSSARETADGLDREARAGRFRGPLHGLPVAVKDLVDTRGIRTTKGSLRYSDRVPEVDDLAVARLRAAGAIIVGKTNTPEFGFGALCRNELAGNTANPYARDRSSGGSSGGAAVAAATGMVALSHGTDFGGSVRTPASFCNVVGFRPGAGVVPRVPKPLPWDSLLTHGVLARSAADAALMASVMSGSDPRDPVAFHAPRLSPRLVAPPNPGDLRIASSPDLGIAEIDDSVRAAFEEAVRRIRESFGTVTEAHPDLSGAKDAFETLRAALLFHDLGPLLVADDPPLAETVRWNVARGRDIDSRAYLAAESERGRLYQRCLTFFDEVDLLVTPSAAVPPFPLSQENVETINGAPTRNIIDYLAITYAISLVGLPAISLPAGTTADGLPFGLQLVAGAGKDDYLLAVAGLMEERLGFRHAFPGEMGD